MQKHPVQGDLADANALITRERRSRFGGNMRVRCEAPSVQHCTIALLTLCRMDEERAPLSNTVDFKTIRRTLGLRLAVRASAPAGAKALMTLDLLQ